MIELEAMSQEPLSVMPRRVKCHGKEPVRVHFPQIEGRTSPIAFPGLSALMVGAKYFLSGRSIYDDCFTLVRLAALSLVLLCFQLPAMLTGPLLGTVLDRWQPRLVMGIDNCTRALLIGAIPVLSWVGVLQLWEIYALALLAAECVS